MTFLVLSLNKGHRFTSTSRRYVLVSLTQETTRDIHTLLNASNPRQQKHTCSFPTSPASLANPTVHACTSRLSSGRTPVRLRSPQHRTSPPPPFHLVPPLKIRELETWLQRALAQREREREHVDSTQVNSISATAHQQA